VETTISALNHLTEAHEALVTVCRSLAVAVDVAPRNAALWREYRGALGELANVGEEADSDGASLAHFLASVRTPVLDSPLS
jgi:hypothetical protein